MINKLSYFTHESLPVYTIVSSFVLNGSVIQFYLINPTFALSNDKHIMAFSKFARVKYVVQMRMAVELEANEETLKIHRWANFGFTYDELASLIYLDLMPQKEYALEKKQKQLFAKLYRDYLKIVFIEDIQKDQPISFQVGLDQYHQAIGQLKASLNWMAGWHLPQDYVKELIPKIN